MEEARRDYHDRLPPQIGPGELEFEVSQNTGFDLHREIEPVNHSIQGLGSRL